jgi:hypothetical protein
MKRFLKGCLITFAILFGLIVIGSIAMYLYWQSPNKIEFSDSPIKKEKYLNSLSFENRQLPDFILKQNERDILYQAYIKDDGLDMTVIYKVVVRLNRDIELANSLPFKSAEKEEINDKIAFNKIDNNGFNPQIKIPEDKKTQSGRHMTIFSPQNKIFLTLKNGWYSYSHDEIDKDGYVTDIIIYDKESKLLYFERQRYYAFQ